MNKTQQNTIAAILKKLREMYDKLEDSKLRAEEILDNLSEDALDNGRGDDYEDFVEAADAVMSALDECIGEVENYT